MTQLEEANCFTDVVVLGGGRRTDDYQCVRGVERGKRQRMAPSEVVVMAKDRAQRLVDCTRDIAPHKILIAAKGFQPAVQPLRPARIGVTVRNEGAVLERKGITHNPPSKGTLDREEMSSSTIWLHLDHGVGFGRRSFVVIFSPRVSGLAVLEKQRRLFVIVTGDEIVVTSDAGFRAAYCRRPHHPQLIIRQRTDTDDHEVVAQAWQAAND